MSGSSPNNPPAFYCEGKVKFHSREIAERAAARRRDRTVYKCPKCREWHVGARGVERRPR